MPIQHPSPNCGARRDGVRPDMVVLHYTAMDGWEKARDWLCNTDAQVSAHYLITPQGDVVQMVDEAARAWHAGAGRWGDICDVNSHSIGIEISNTGATPFAAAQMDALDALLADILRRWDIPAARVIGHSDMAPGRKIDPGVRFDWQRLARRGLAVWPNAGDPVPPDATRFRADAARAGYTADVDGATLLTCVRLRFRPWARGPLDGTDMAVIADIAHRFPVDAKLASA